MHVGCSPLLVVKTVVHRAKWAGLQAPLGRFVSIYAWKHLGICSTRCFWMPRITLSINNLKCDKIYLLVWCELEGECNHHRERLQRRKGAGKVMRRWPEKAYNKEVLLPLLCITSSSPLIFLTHHKGQSWKRCSVHHFAVNFVYVTITLKLTLEIQEMSLQTLLRIMPIFFSHSLPF